MHGTTEISFFVKGGIIFAVDSRATNNTTKKEKHRFYEKVHEFNNKLFATRCGNKRATEAMFECLEQVQNPTLGLIASTAHDYMTKHPEEEVATLVVGYHGETAKIYKVTLASGVEDIDLYAAIGTGSGSACRVLKERCVGPDMSFDEGMLVAQYAMVEAALNDPSTGEWICINHLDGKSGVRTVTREGVLKYYLDKYKYHQSFPTEGTETSERNIVTIEGKTKTKKQKIKSGKGNTEIKMEAKISEDLKVLKARKEKSALYVLIHSSLKFIEPKVMGKLFVDYGKSFAEKSHCLGLFGVETDVGNDITPWKNEYHLHRVQFGDSNAADDVYGLLKRKYETIKDKVCGTADFGDLDATYMQVSGIETDMAAIVCKESKAMLAFIMQYSPESWRAHANELKWS